MESFNSGKFSTSTTSVSEFKSEKCKEMKLFQEIIANELSSLVDQNLCTIRGNIQKEKKSVLTNCRNQSKQIEKKIFGIFQKQESIFTKYANILPAQRKDKAIKQVKEFFKNEREKTQELFGKFQVKIELKILSIEMQDLTQIQSTCFTGRTFDDIISKFDHHKIERYLKTLEQEIMTILEFHDNVEIKKSITGQSFGYLL